MTQTAPLEDDPAVAFDAVRREPMARWLRVRLKVSQSSTWAQEMI